MARRGKIKKRLISSDPVYKDRLVSRLINRVLKDGKKTVAQKHVYKAFAQIKEKKGDPMETFNKALRNIEPQVEVRPRRVGGASYQVPMSVKGNRRTTLAIRWLIQAAQKRSNKEYHDFSKKLAAEILDASQGLGEAVRKKELTRRMAEANRAFAHFRW